MIPQQGDQIVATKIVLVIDVLEASCTGLEISPLRVWKSA